ncbi:phospholipase A and acyltransferase 4-like [Hippoglossus stenolepis]|uniref:phospholipase A and acyltransferase 4-like n=1 Tax=Hippoglossus stenolepis TaxID=195615 RepID=UPI001FB0057E|nr:phospholipase A and acyltransferase 4-like [Hippoglossus stenolepis]
MAQTFNGKPGDLIEISRWGYQHWAVYIGENEVVHLVPEGGDSSGSFELLSSRGEVKREKLTDVVGNHRCQVNNLLDNSGKARDPSIIVKEACAMVGSELQYNVATYNCEHFATEMRYGKAKSWQVIRAAWIAGLTAAGGALAAMGAALFRYFGKEEKEEKKEEENEKGRLQEEDIINTGTNETEK